MFYFMSPQGMQKVMGVQKLYPTFKTVVPLLLVKYLCNPHYLKHSFA